MTPEAGEPPARPRVCQKMPAQFIAPMKALNTGQVPTGEWDCEIKFDGYRAIAVLNRGNGSLWSRTGKPMSRDYPEVIGALEKLRCRDAVLDGEIVALDAAGRSRFQLLQNRGRSEKKPIIVYYVFDLMRRDGRSLLALALTDRRKELASLAKKLIPPLQISPVFRVEPAALLKLARQQGLEGIIAKQPGSRYEPDRRSGSWVKCKVLAEQEFVIGGFTRPRHSREYFGAILVGYYTGGRLRYAGKVGTGFDRAQLASLHASFVPRTRKTCPFANLPLEGKPRFGEGMGRKAMEKVTWLKPGPVAQIKFAEWTDDGLLRQPVFLGLRTDKRASDVRREPGPAGR
jgi:bifunctional non-homologous end joining protein LigD